MIKLIDILNEITIKDPTTGVLYVKDDEQYQHYGYYNIYDYYGNELSVHGYKSSTSEEVVIHGNKKIFEYLKNNDIPYTFISSIYVILVSFEYCEFV